MTGPGGGTAPRTIGVVPHPERAHARELARRAVATLTAAGATVRLPDPDGRGLDLPGARPVPATAFAHGLDAAVSIGGDGTMLRTVSLVAGAGVPVLGVNAGRLGFLTAVEASGLEAALRNLLAGRVLVEERMLLEVRVPDRLGVPTPLLALNEAVIEKHHPGHLTRLRVRLDGRPWATYAADALIVASPTGSTAYAFSAHGPIVSPRLACILLVPASPHMLFDRTLVLDPDVEVAVEVAEDRRARLTVDGRCWGELDPGDVVGVRRAAGAARLLTLEARDFHGILRRRFRLAEE